MDKEKPEGPYCQVVRMFRESKSCPELDESRGAKEPFCRKLGKGLGWDRAGHILKECNMKCANYMNRDEIRETVKQHQERYGNPGEPPFYDLSDLNLTRNCSICDFGGTGSPRVDQVVRVLEEDSIKLQEAIKRLSGEPLKRVCFKELKEGKNKQSI